jgi:nucleoside-diphosphate-sugar epimerase
MATTFKAAENGRPTVDKAQKPRILVTGASGKIGRHVVAELARRGYAVRALTRQVSPELVVQPLVEWRQFSWDHSWEFDSLVDGCVAVLHLGAELRHIEKMQRSNVDAVRALVRSAEQCSVKFFCYVSSVAVYGSSVDADVNEQSPVLTCDRDVKSEYFAEEYLRCYGRTKLAGERVVAEEAKRAAYVILRPSVVVDIPDLIELRDWSKAKKAIAAHRHSHQIYVLDVVHAMLWFMERNLHHDRAAPVMATYNLSNDDVVGNTYGYFFREAFRRTADPAFRTIELPSLFDRTRDVFKFRLAPVRHSLGSMRFFPAKLYSTGYRHRYGILHAHEMAFAAMAEDNLA